MKWWIAFVASLFVLLSLSYVIAESQGLTDGARIASALADLHQQTGTSAVVALAVGGLLALDLVLPVPSSVLMTLAGYFLGWAVGAAVTFAGAMASAALGFWLCRRFGQRAFRRLAGEADSGRVSAWLERSGAWAILLSRAVPMLTEITSCLAGLGTMPFRRFLALSAAGTAPICLVYAWAGSRSAEATAGLAWAVLIALVIPAVGFGALRFSRRGEAARRSPPSPALTTVTLGSEADDE